MNGSRENEEPLPTFVMPVGVRKMRLARGIGNASSTLADLAG